VTKGLDNVSPVDTKVVIQVKIASEKIGRWLRSGPISFLMSAAILVVFIVAMSVGREVVEPNIAAGAGHGWWTVFTTVAWTKSPIHMVIDIALMLSVGIWLERVVTSPWYLIIGNAIYCVSAVVTIGIATLNDNLFPHFKAPLESQEIVGVAVFLIGIASAASFKMIAEWRKRTRAMVASILLVMLAFVGSLGTIFTFIAALIGTLFGFIFWGKNRDKRPAVMRGPQDKRALVAIVVAGIVFGTLITLRSPDMVGGLSSLRYPMPADALSAETVSQICSVENLRGMCLHYSYLLRTGGNGNTILALMPLLLQLILAWGLRGGRRAAWWGTIILQALTAVVAGIHLLVIWNEVRSWSEGAEALGFTESGRPTARFIVPLMMPLVLLIVAFVQRKLFTVRATAGTYERLWRNFSAVTAATLLVTLIIGVIIGATKTFLSTIWVLTTDFLIRLLPSSVLSLVTPQMDQETAAGIILMSWMPIIPWVAICALLLISFRRRELPNSIGQSEYIAIAKTTGPGSMGWITTWPQNKYWKASSCSAAIAYRVDRGVALTVSDPAVLPEDLPEVLEEFARFATDQGLTPAFYSVHAPVVTVTDQWRWSRLQVAEEAVLLLSELEFKGKRLRDVRTALNRAKREGIHTEWTTYEACKPALLEQVKQISAEWVSDKPLPGMSFTFGGINELNDPEVRILLAVDEKQTVHGVTSWMPIYDEGQITGWTLDFMRRLTGGFRPVMEYLIVSAALWAKDEGYETLSLSGTPLVKTKGQKGTDESAGLDQLLDVLGQTLEPVYGFRSLLNFKAAFNPEYVPIYLAVPTTAELPTVGLAIAHAHLPHLALRETVALGSHLLPKETKH